MLTDINPEPPPPEPRFDLSAIIAPDKILAEGVYFDLPEDIYHGSFGLSYSGIKHLRISPYDWWVRSPLNPNQAAVQAEESSTVALEMGAAFDARIICGREYFYQHYGPTISAADYPDALRTSSDMEKWLEARGLPKTAKSKALLIQRILSVDPTVQSWDQLEEGYTQAHKGKKLISQDLIDRIELATAMIEKHPELSQALTGGAPQVSVVWYCEKTGVLCRSRFDYLKPKVIVDLKTLQPREGSPLESSIGREIGHRKYYIQTSYYLEAAANIPRLIKEGKVYGKAPPALLDALVKHPAKEWLWIFQLKGVAPVAKGRLLSHQSNLMQLGTIEVDNAKHLFRACLDKYGALPWVDPEPIKAMDDADVPAWALI